MKIELNRIKISELISGYKNDPENGVIGYDGKLNIRPAYQREFVYNEKQSQAVISSIFKNFPLNVMYWLKHDDDSYELIDGQQRTLSICKFTNGDFAFENRFFHNLQTDEKNAILNYEIMVYFCEGTDSEKLDWFRTINISGEKLTNQELRNAVYSGSWCSDAKRYFSKNGCSAYQIGSKLMQGHPIRQDYLETTLKWISNDNIESYMAKNQNKPYANELWLYFTNVINWVNITFSNYRREMKGVQWGLLYNQFKDVDFGSINIEAKVCDLMLDDDVTNKKGVYWYVLTNNEKYLNLRAFSTNQKREAYEKQNGICPICGKHFSFEEMEADHIIPWHKGGKTHADNCQMLCVEDNRIKSGK